MMIVLWIARSPVIKYAVWHYTGVFDRTAYGGYPLGCSDAAYLIRTWSLVTTRSFNIRTFTVHFYILAENWTQSLLFKVSDGFVLASSHFLP